MSNVVIMTKGVVRENNFLYFFSSKPYIRMKFYKCITGIARYGTVKERYFIPGKIYKSVENDYSTLIDEFGNKHTLGHYIFSTHFKPLTSNKRHRNDKDRREV